MSSCDYNGLLFIGDPHLSSRVPGFRKDNYPEVVLNKLIWILDYAQANRLLPVILGDLFHWPRDNANWLVVRLMDIIGRKNVLGIVGNHDTTMHILQEDDTLAIIEAAGSIELLDRSGPWTGTIGGRSVLIGGSTWSSRLPRSVDHAQHKISDDTFVVWLTHHNVAFTDHDSSAWYRPHEIPGVDLVINGHIHTPCEGVQVGCTTWLNPGNIARVTRGDTHRTRIPQAIRIDISAEGWKSLVVGVPHQDFDDVFYAMGVDCGGPEINVSAFVQGLESLRTLRTASGEGLLEFLDKNLHTDDAAVRDEIVNLAMEVMDNEHT